MWMPKQLVGRSERKPEMQEGIVTASRGTVVVQGESETRGMRVALPWGMESLPPEGSPALVFPSLGICTGIVSQAAVEPGELAFRSLGGAEIILKNSGEVIINGQVFPAKEEET